MDKTLVERPDARPDCDGDCFVCGLPFDEEDGKHRCPDGFLISAELGAAFAKAFAGKQYGREETANAFHWFRDGFNARIAELEAQLAEQTRLAEQLSTSVSGWQEDARQYALNAEHWRGLAEERKREVERQKRELVGWLSADIPELRCVLVPDLDASLERFNAAIEAHKE